MNSEFQALTTEQQAAVRKAVELARENGWLQRIATKDGAAYAYLTSPTSGDCLHWNFTHDEHGLIARGVIEAGEKTA